MRSLVVLLIFAVSCATAWSQAYKWRDASGRIQYSDTPPPAGAQDVQQLRKPLPGGAATEPAAGSTYAEKDAAFRKRQIEQQEAAKKSAQAAEDERVRSRNCEQARGQLASLDSGQRMVRMNAQGERVALDDKERAQARDDTLKAIESWCK